MEEILTFTNDIEGLCVKSSDIASITRKDNKIIIEYIVNGIKYDHTFVFSSSYYAGSYYASAQLKKWIKMWKKSF